MKLIKDVTDPNLTQSAISIISRLKEGDRVFGNPGEGLKKTLVKKEKEFDELEKNRSKLDFSDDDGGLNPDIKKLKAGIKGEEDLAEYIENIVKADPRLRDIVTFASLSDPRKNSGGDEYISDSDFIMVHGSDILIVDSKNINTNPEMPLSLIGKDLVPIGADPILTINPSVFIWKEIFNEYGVKWNSVHGLTVIVNKKGALIWKNANWHKSEVKPIHIFDFVDFLNEWIEGKSNETSLQLLTTLSEMQIKKNDAGIDLNYFKSVFKM